MTKKFKKQDKTVNVFQLAPFGWIAKEIEFQKYPIFFVDQDSSKKVKDTFFIELPEDRKDESIQILKELSRKGVDPNYLDVILWYFSDPVRRTDVKALDQASVEKIHDLLKLLKNAPSEIEGLISSKKFKEFKTLVNEIVSEIIPVVENDSTSSTIFCLPKIKEKSPKGGRPSDDYMNKIILLTYRALKKKIKSTGKFKGPVRYTFELLSSCFPTTLKHASYNSLKTRIRLLANNEALLRECYAFERRYRDVGKKFLRNNQNYEYSPPIKIP